MTEPAPASDDAPQAGSTLNRRLAIAVGALAVIAVLLLTRGQAADWLASFTAFVKGLGIWAPIVFIGGYALFVAALIPGSVLTIAAGAIFGLTAGTAYAFCGAALGSIGGFLIARYAARGWVERRIEFDERFIAIDRAVAASGFKITFLLRLSPVFPFSMLNYALGLTRVSLRDYALASFGMLPGTLLYVYYGKLAGDVAAAATGAPESGAAQLALNVVGLLATIGVTVLVTRIARRALADATGSSAAATAPSPSQEIH